ncbi:MAG: hypothetical protein IPO81_03375 [Kouleothrix sp.]|nr:hypothetical protein [Kouleothrix sp.]
MGDNKPQKKRGRAVPPRSSSSSPADFRRANEKMLQDVGKLLSQQQFETTEEMNAYLQSVLASGGPPAMAPESPLERAQEIMYKAWEASGARRVKLARQAIEISPDCADAYVLLAEEARNPRDAKEFYEQGVQAGARALGPHVFEEDAGHFWGIIETRPYMRARAGLAASLWQLGERAAAIEHYADMLRLNPGDNQGLRYVLASCLLRQGDDEALAKLLDQYDDASAEWYYTRSLLLFRGAGASADASAALKNAFGKNRFVPDYLLGKKRLPRQPPAYISPGDDTEAVSYAAGAADAWRETPGALEWLSSNLADGLGDARARAR